MKATLALHHTHPNPSSFIASSAVPPSFCTTMDPDDSTYTQKRTHKESSRALNDQKKLQRRQKGRDEKRP